MGQDDELVSYLQRVAGYALSGDVSAHAFFLLYGTGQNGKSTFLETLRDVLGTYAATVSPELLATRSHDPHPAEKVVLKGLRMAVASEPPSGRSLNEARVKELTGGDRVTARGMHENPWEFPPTHKLFLATNHRPRVVGNDDGLWRRMRLVPWCVRIPDDQKDPALRSKLKKESSAILAWAVRGCLEYQRIGLAEPKAVMEATRDYRSDMDVVGQFIDERCVLNPHARTSARALFEAFAQWAQRSGYEVGNQKVLADRLKERGLEPFRTNAERSWMGIGLKIGGEHLVGLAPSKAGVTDGDGRSTSFPEFVCLKERWDERHHASPTMAGSNLTSPIEAVGGQRER